VTAAGAWSTAKVSGEKHGIAPPRGESRTWMKLAERLSEQIERDFGHYPRGAYLGSLGDFLEPRCSSKRRRTTAFTAA